MAVRCRNATWRRSSSVKVAAPLTTCAKEEQRSVIHFLSSEGVKPIEIHWRMKVQYGDACLSLQHVHKWSRKFMNGISYVTDSPWPGQAHQVVTPEAIAAVEAIVKENCHVTVIEIAARLDMSHGSAHHIVHDVLQIKKYLIFKVFIWLTLMCLKYVYSKHLHAERNTLVFWTYIFGWSTMGMFYLETMKYCL